MALIIPRGWLRNRRPAPFDRRTPLIIPAGGGRVPPETEYLGEIWNIFGSLEASYYLSLFIPIRADWYYSHVGPIGQSRYPGTAKIGEKFFGPVAFSNTYQFGNVFRSEYLYSEIWPAFIKNNRFSESGIGNTVKWETARPYYYWSEKSRQPASRIIYSISASGSAGQSAYVGPDGKLKRAGGADLLSGIYPPAPYNTEEWVHIYLGQSNPPIYPVNEVQAAAGRSAILNPFMILEKTGETEWEIQHITPKTINFTYDWYSTLLQGHY